MAFGISDTLLALTGFYLILTVVKDCHCNYVVVANNPEDKNCICPGPTKYYEELGCTPVFKDPKDCCPVRYNCDAWKDLPSGKCFLNGHLYSFGEKLRQEDKNPCDNCGCIGSGFSCTSVYCQPRPNCYRKKSTVQCCGEEVCSEKEEDRPTCVVDGKIYKDGEFFIPSTEPEKHCYCGEGYSGENVEPFCATPKHTWCNTLIYHASEIRQGCAPVYFFKESPQKDCNANFRCPSASDTIIERTNEISKLETSESEDTEMSCHFGNLEMRVGDELNQNGSYDATHTKCVCEVPPLPTCRRTTRYTKVYDFWPSGLMRYISDEKFKF